MGQEVKENAPLTGQEKRDLARLEKFIERTLEDTNKLGAEIAQALCQIRDARLYRATHETFEAYFRERFGMSRQRAYQLLDWGYLSTRVDVPVNTEMESRQLMDALPPELRKKVRDAGETVPPEEIREVVELLQKSRAERVAEINRREEEHRSRASDRRGSNSERIDQIERLVRRLRKLHAGLTDVADEADIALDGYVKVVRKSEA